MGRELYRTQSSFRRTLDRCAELLAPELERPLLEVLFAERGAATALDDTAFTQPALFAVEYALARLWLDWGLEPAALLGHSVGEYVAACVAGVFTLEDALRLIAARGRLMQALPRDGAMTAVLAPLDVVRGALRPHAGLVDVAAVNGADHVVISGARERVARVAAALATAGVRTVPLRVSHAFHSPLMEPMLAEFERAVQAVTLRPPRVDVISNVSGRADPEEMATAAYWVKHVRAAVRFHDGMQSLAEREIDVFLEVGPAPTLLAMGRRCLPAHAEAAWLASLAPGRSEWAQVADSLAELYVRGAPIDWARFDRDYPRRKRSLPTYRFERTRHWFERRAEGGAGLREPHALPARLYDGLAEAGADLVLSEPGGPVRRRDRLLTYAPFADIVPGFSWATFLLAPEREPAHARLAYEAQREMREVLFRHVDFDACRRALDLGCGYGSDLIALAEQHPHLALDGYTLSERQAHVAQQKLHARGLDARVHVYRRDSVTDPFPGRYDLAFAFEVVHHVRDKARLFAHLGRHLEDGGLVVLADFVSHVTPAIEDHAGASFFLTADQWAETLAEAGIEIVEGVDVSPEIANFLHDERFDEHLAALRVDATVRAAFRSYHRGGELLRKGLAGYVLLTARKRAAGSRDELARASRRALEAPKAYASLVPGRWLYRPEWRPLSAAPDAATPGHGLTMELERLAGGYVVDALDRLGWKAGADARAPIPEIAARLGVVPRYHRLLRRLFEIAGEEARSPSPRRRASEPARRDSSASAELALVERCGSRLAEVLRGETDPLELLFPGGALTPLARLYRDGEAFHAANRLVGRALADLLVRPRSGPLRVLEVGAGTGATTAAVLPVLGGHPVEYVFSDVSAVFLRTAREAFADCPFVRYARLDLERPPESQGFEARGFDVVIAVNVLHATADLRRTLGHVATLLAPGGTLVLGEIVARRRWLDLCFGLLDGWWKFEDQALRAEHPLLDAPRWRALLAETGFEAPELAAPDGPEHPVDTSVIVARRTTASPVRPVGSWIVFADVAGTGRELARRLRAEGDHCTLVAPAEAFARDGEHELRIDPTRREDFARVLRAAAARAPLRGLVHLWGLDADSVAGVREPALPAAAERACVGALHLVQALAEHAGADAVPLWLVTRGAVAAGPVPTVPGLAQSPLLGLARVIDWEHPELPCRRVDLDPDDRSHDVDALLAELRAPSLEDRIALRGGVRHAERLVRLPLPPRAAPPPCRIRAEATYLVTGGFGDLGRLVAERLVARGARHLVLVGRRPPDALARETIARLEADGTRVLAAPADVADAASLAAVVEDVVRSWPPLRGVVHAAGTLDDGILLQLDAERLRRVMAPKVRGAWWLHELTRGLALDFFVLFSSTAALLGNPGQANHAAANAFLDALAHHRRALGLPALSIDWGAWAETGAAARGGAAARFQTKGIEGIPPGAGLEILERLLGADVAQAAVVRVQWESFLAEYPPGSRSPFLRDLAPAAPLPAGRRASTAEDRRLRLTWEQAPVAERRALLLAFVRELTARVVGAKAAQVRVDLPLSRMGLDSLMAVEMRHTLHRELGVDVPVVALMQATGIVGLADDLESRLAGGLDGDVVEGAL
jgi:acyl transferase domain-containing protein/cyclopropane fatty-acyl-phospholipid synthase-like methyltransferase